MDTIPTWDLFVGIALILGLVYGFILQREKTMTTLLAIYLGIVVVQIWGESVQQFFQGEKQILGNFVRSDASPAVINSIIFLLIVALISAKSSLGFGKGTALSPIETTVYSLLSTTLIIATILGYLPEDMRNSLLEQSRFLTQINHFYHLLLLAPIVLVLLVAARKEK